MKMLEERLRWVKIILLRGRGGVNPAQHFSEKVLGCPKGELFTLALCI